MNPMNPSRLTLRHLLFLVTLAGLALGLSGWMRRRAEFSSRTAYHAKQYRVLLAHLAGARGMRRGRGMASPDPSELASVRYHFKMAEKYEHAARYPWLPVEPDPPEPKDAP
jgi:hypothetical protein